MVRVHQAAFDGYGGVNEPPSSKALNGVNNLKGLAILHGKSFFIISPKNIYIRHVRTQADSSTSLRDVRSVSEARALTEPYSGVSRWPI